MNLAGAGLFNEKWADSRRPKTIAKPRGTRHRMRVMMRLSYLPLIVGIAFAGIVALSVNADEASKTEAAGQNVTESKKEKMSDSKNHEIATIGGGCFWCTEAVLERIDGVADVVSGYMGGHVEHPTYEQICQKNTGHVEVVQVVYNPKKISTSDVLAWFWELHDPTSKDQQGADKGPQYRSAVFCHSEEQKNLTEASMKKAQKLFEKPIVTVIRKAEKFWVAEDFHQDFYFLNKQRNGYCRIVIQPKLLKLKLKD